MVNPGFHRGGFGAALGCHYRVMANTARVRGQHWLVALLPNGHSVTKAVGAEKTLEIILWEALKADEALSLGIVDHVVKLQRRISMLQSNLRSKRHWRWAVVTLFLCLAFRSNPHQGLQTFRHGLNE